jgi:hypothetical protein
MKTKIQTFVLVCLLIVWTLGCARQPYVNVASEAKIAGVKTEMTEKQVREVMGDPDDVQHRERTAVKVMWYPLTLLILPIFYHPPYSEKTYYYKDQGRVLLRTGWSGDVNFRVIEVAGDPTEDGYQ